MVLLGFLFLDVLLGFLVLVVLLGFLVPVVLLGFLFLVATKPFAPLPFARLIVYPLISTFGKMLYDATVEGCREDDNAVEIVKAHIDAMGAVLREKVAGDGGEVGRTLLTSLKKAIESKEAVVK